MASESSVVRIYRKKDRIFCGTGFVSKIATTDRNGELADALHVITCAHNLHSGEAVVPDQNFAIETTGDLSRDVDANLVFLSRDIPLHRDIGILRLPSDFDANTHGVFVYELDMLRTELSEEEVFQVAGHPNLQGGASTTKPVNFMGRTQVLDNSAYSHFFTFSGIDPQSYKGFSGGPVFEPGTCKVIAIAMSEPDKSVIANGTFRAYPMSRLLEPMRTFGPAILGDGGVPCPKIMKCNEFENAFTNLDKFALKATHAVVIQDLMRWLLIELENYANDVANSVDASNTFCRTAKCATRIRKVFDKLRRWIEQPLAVKRGGIESLEELILSGLSYGGGPDLETCGMLATSLLSLIGLVDRFAEVIQNESDDGDSATELFLKYTRQIMNYSEVYFHASESNSHACQIAIGEHWENSDKLMMVE